MTPLELTEGQRRVLAAEGHLLVQGGPGSGKTTISILKAGQIAESDLGVEQRVLFLSFARSTVGRVLEAIRSVHGLERLTAKSIEVDTYHAFFWRLISKHAYLLGLPKRISLLAPQSEAVVLSRLRRDIADVPDLPDDERAACLAEAEAEARRGLAFNDGRVAFDLFAPLVGDLLQGSPRFRELVASRYPVIVLDEFQDTTAEQWRAVLALGDRIRLLALADPEQRIYDFIGADPARLQHFRDAFHPTEVDLKSDNHRSANTDIAHFGNDILTASCAGRSYKGVEFVFYPPNAAQAYSKLVAQILKSVRRFRRAGNDDWTLAVLTPNKALARIVCDQLESPPGGLPRISHQAIIDIEGVMLAAELMAFALQPPSPTRKADFIALVASWLRGRGGDDPNKGDLSDADKLESVYAEGLSKLAVGKQPRANSVSETTLRVLRTVDEGESTGEPYQDWRRIRDAFAVGECHRLRRAAADARNVRLLTRGADLRGILGDGWRTYGDYRGALDAFRTAFAKEQLAGSMKNRSGLIVMNMHKAKGKQFDEVIVFEAWPRRYRGEIKGNPHRFCRGNIPGPHQDQARQALRVAVTRAKTQCSFLTPADDVCILLR